MSSVAGADYTVYLELTEEQIEREVKRLTKEIEALRDKRKRLSEKLSNPNFLNKAPKHVVDKFRAELSETEAKLNRLEERLKALS